MMESLGPVATRGGLVTEIQRILELEQIELCAFGAHQIAGAPGQHDIRACGPQRAAYLRDERANAGFPRRGRAFVPQPSYETFDGDDAVRVEQQDGAEGALPSAEGDGVAVPLDFQGAQQPEAKA
jgi:hypothetical protein